MPSFSYTGGDISHLTGGFTPASMADIQGPFTDLRTALNGGLDEVNVPNLSAAFTTYKEIARGFAGQTSASGTGTWAMPLGAPPVATDIAFNNANSAVWAIQLYLDPADYAANARSTRLRVRAVAVPSVAPAVTFTVGLYPVATYTTGASIHPRVATLGTVVSGSTAAIASPAVGVVTKVDSSDFSFPAAGAYVLGIAMVATPAATSVTDIVASLQMRQV